MNQTTDHNVGMYPDAELLRRAVMNARNPHARKRERHPRYLAVMSAFALGSTFAAQLCVRFGLDPDELIRRSV